MASPLETYMKKMKRNNALTNVSLPGGVMVYDKDAEREKIESEYLATSKTPAQAQFKVMNSPSRSARMSRQQNQAMDNKIVQEGMLMNQFDMARGLGGREGIQKIKEIAESTPGGVDVFNKMNKGQITFNELMGSLSNPDNIPKAYKPSDTELMQMENLIKQGMLPDDIKANPAMAKVYEQSSKLQAMAEGNLNAIMNAEERQIASDERDKRYKEQQRMEEAAYMDEMLKDKAFYGPGVDSENLNRIAKDYVKYGDDNVLNMASALMGEYESNNQGVGMLGYLNVRSKLKEHGASEDQLKKFDDYGQSARINELERQAPQMKSMQELLAERAGDPMEIKKVENKYNLAKKKPSKLKEGLLKTQLSGQKFAKALTGNQDWKQYVQEGGFISKLGNFGKEVYDRYVGDPVAAGRLESIMASTDSEGNAISQEQAREIRDAGGGSADLSTTVGRGLNQAGRDIATGAGVVAGGVAALPGVIGKGLEKGYEGLTKDKASYEDVASGKEKGSLLQRLGKGMAFAGNVVDVFNAPDPSQAMGQVDIKFSSGKGKDKVQQIDLGETDVNKDLTVRTDQVSEEIENVDKSGIEVEGIDGKVIPSVILNKVKSADELKNLSPEQLMTVQKALGGIAVDGKFGPETRGAMEKYLAGPSQPAITNPPEVETPPVSSAPTRSQEEIVQSYPAGVDPNNPFPIIKQQGGFISELMKYQRGGLV